MLEAIQKHNAAAAAAADSTHHHLQAHKRILAHLALQHLKLTDAAQHLREAAAAATTDTAISQELKHHAPSKVLISVQFAEVSQADLARLGVSPGSFHPAAAAAKDWQDALSAVVAASDRSLVHQQLCQPELIANSPWELDVAVCPQVCARVLVCVPEAADCQYACTTL